MTAFVKLQEREFEMERSAGFQAVKHQRFVGAGYFDQVQMTVTGGEVSTSALKARPKRSSSTRPPRRRSTDRRPGGSGPRLPFSF